MEIILLVLGFILLITGLLGAVIPILPGPPLSFAGLLLIHFSGFAVFSPVFLLLWAGITIAVTVMDYILPAILTKKFGGSRAAAIGSVIGLLAGIIFFPPWGIIFGSFLGAFAGEFIHNSSDGGKAFKAALGAFLAFLVGSGIKLVVSSIMLFYAVRTLLQS